MTDVMNPSSPLNLKSDRPKQMHKKVKRAAKKQAAPSSHVLHGGKPAHRRVAAPASDVDTEVNAASGEDNVTAQLNRDQLAKLNGGAQTATATAPASQGAAFETKEQTIKRQDSGERERRGVNAVGAWIGGGSVGTDRVGGGRMYLGETPVRELTPAEKKLVKEQDDGERTRRGINAVGAWIGGGSVGTDRVSGGRMYLGDTPVPEHSDAEKAMVERQKAANVETRKNYGPRPN